MSALPGGTVPSYGPIPTISNDAYRAMAPKLVTARRWNWPLSIDKKHGTHKIRSREPAREGCAEQLNGNWEPERGFLSSNVLRVWGVIR